MSDDVPLVTVLMPVRNGASYLPASLDSIFAQRFSDFEFLVIDDGSADDTPAILRAVRDPRLRVVTHPRNLGLVPTLNEGLELARGEFIARQDHDDVSHPDRLGRQVEYLRTHPECVLAGTQAFATIGHEARAYRLLRPLGAESIGWYQCFDNAFIHSTVMFRREPVLREFGGYAPSFHSEDYALWSRIARHRPTANLPEPLLNYREHAASVTGAMSPADAAAFDGATAAIRLANLRAHFGDEATAADARVLSTYRRDFTPAKAEEFVRIFDRLSALSKHRPAETDDLCRTRAMQLAELAYRLLPLARRPALALYQRAFRLHSPLIRDLPWARIAALLILGGAARKIHTLLSARAGKSAL